jgi:hypothetical protein
MIITPLPQVGGSSKFRVTLKRGEFVIALSRTLCVTKWEITTPEAQLAAATRMAEAIVGRHDPALPFKSTYVFGEHNTQPTVEAMIKFLAKTQLV